MSVDVDILTTNIAHAIVVPADGVVKESGRSYVFIVRGGTVHKQRVRTGATNDTQAVILSGLHLGDVIVAEKTVDISEGSAVAAAVPSAAPTKK